MRRKKGVRGKREVRCIVYPRLENGVTGRFRRGDLDTLRISTLFFSFLFWNMRALAWKALGWQHGSGMRS
jgi:hypothetical protein